MPLENGDAFDSCSVVVYSYDQPPLSGGCGLTSTTGSSLVTFTATDACGNTATRQATVSIVDSTPPAITSPAIDEVVECDGFGNTTELNAWLASNGGAMSEDVCSDISWLIPTLIETIEGCGNSVEYIYEFRSMDECGNISAASIASFVILDRTSPEINVLASNESVSCNGTGNTTDLDTWLAASGGAMATDVCGGTLTWSYDLVSESDLCDLTGSGTYIFTVSDECGNTSTTEATFEITDTEAPTILTEATDFEVVCDGDNNVAELLNWLNSNAGATASDNCNEITWTNNYGEIDAGACVEKEV